MHIQDEKTLEVARRTRANLQFMDEQYRLGAEVYEFTQLLNSMLGMIICVREDYLKAPQGSSEPAVTWQNIIDAGLHVSSDVRSKADAFSTLISNLRHGLAHNGYDFLVSNGEITGIRVETDRGWAANLSETELREIADLAVDYLERKLKYGVRSL